MALLRSEALIIIEYEKYLLGLFIGVQQFTPSNDNFLFLGVQL
jgi:hypothetical protein